MFFVWYVNLDRSFYRFVTIHACVGRTDRILITIPRLHYMQRGKKNTLNSQLLNNQTGGPFCHAGYTPSIYAEILADCQDASLSGRQSSSDQTATGRYNLAIWLSKIM